MERTGPLGGVRLEDQIGANIKAFREARGLSQSQFGQAVGQFVGGQGWTRQVVWNAERGHKDFSAAELLGIAAALGVTVPQLFESPRPLIFPSGAALPEQSAAALMQGTDIDADRRRRISYELRMLGEVQRDLDLLAKVVATTLLNLRAAIAGAPDIESAVQTSTDLRAIMKGIEAIGVERVRQTMAARWAHNPKLRAFEETGKGNP